MKRLLLIMALLVAAWQLAAQDTLRVELIADSVTEVGTGKWEPMHDTVYLYRTDTVTVYRTDSVYILHTDTVTVRVTDTAALSALREKEKFYREILSNNGVDKEKLEAERNHYIKLVDSLRAIVRIAEIEAVRKDEANKFLAEKAKAAEEKIAATNSKKKKIRPIQGAAMRFYRTPDWELVPSLTSAGSYELIISNKNGGSVEFDYVTGASVMLWDLTPAFNKNHTFSSDTTKRIRRFDQEFAYDLGFYVGFGGTNLFRNFYTGLSFRFVDFFYLTFGVNIAEYKVLKDGYEVGMSIGSTNIDYALSDVWLVKPFLALNIDLDFLSYIKK